MASAVRIYEKTAAVVGSRYLFNRIFICSGDGLLLVHKLHVLNIDGLLDLLSSLH